MRLKSLHHYNFRHGIEDPEVIGIEHIKPDGLDSRWCFKVIYHSDKLIDYIPVRAVDGGEWELILSEFE